MAVQGDEICIEGFLGQDVSGVWVEAKFTSASDDGSVANRVSQIYKLLMSGSLYFDRLDINQVDAIVASVLESGVAIFPSYLDSCRNELMKRDLFHGLERQEMWLQPGDSTGARISLSETRGRFPELQSTFGNSSFREISKKFWASDYIDYCHDIYLMRGVVGQRTYAHDLHIDVIPQLKFFFYLNDVTRDNGAFEFVPGSQKWSKDFRAVHGDKISFKNREITRELPDLGPPQALEAPAGTLFIFDTDVFHRAGAVKAGERLVVRGHVRKLEQAQQAGIVRRVIDRLVP